MNYLCHYEKSYRMGEEKNSFVTKFFNSRKKTYKTTISSTYYSNFYSGLHSNQLVLISIQFYGMLPQELLIQS